ncbi:MAG TPA: pyrroline-5-carboxylate reductase [Candidatus Obscuribacter sp.]|nr:pyrroline-5-carboxylate reductase [Candidatus Obscuribacter sp.]HMY52160.1 pyrroline-5-carboxylate reductase [Candidatus Obscuribacter sp.]HNA74827.1 pyrroline-5-carboxylate reductase [Candidatus Obscuribacter sp.]HNB16228.1 pyrroline-5-carboxylate reductase [Candidatus Obscuribacter sp.]HND05669.1 pyrroline-5-carboxylate reductase [Candidatus Obscuribacter sp.]
MLEGKKLAVIGVGKLGEALISGLLKNGALKAEDVCGTVGRENSISRVREKLPIAVSLDNKEAVKGKDLILLAVKPQNMAKVLLEIKDVIEDHQLLISVAASVSTAFVEEKLGRPAPVVRAMPNTPSVINAGMTGLCGGSQAKPEHLKACEAIFRCVGETVFVDESLMDAVTALSASGPAYLYVVIESLAEAGVKLGIPRETSTLLAAQTMYGAAKMVLESKAHPALLKDTVTTPAGCTIDGLMELEEGKLRVTLIKAVVKAAERARELVHR